MRRPVGVAFEGQAVRLDLHIETELQRAPRSAPRPASRTCARARRGSDPRSDRAEATSARSQAWRSALRRASRPCRACAQPRARARRRQPRVRGRRIDRRGGVRAGAFGLPISQEVAADALGGAMVIALLSWATGGSLPASTSDRHRSRLRERTTRAAQIDSANSYAAILLFRRRIFTGIAVIRGMALIR